MIRGATVAMLWFAMMLWLRRYDWFAVQRFSDWCSDTMLLLVRLLQCIAMLL